MLTHSVRGLAEQYRRHKNRGFSLIEILLVIGIVAVLALAAFVIYPRVMDAQRTNTAIKNLQAYVSAARTTYPVHRRTGTIYISSQGRAQIIPTSWYGATGALPWSTLNNE